MKEDPQEEPIVWLMGLGLQPRNGNLNRWTGAGVELHTDGRYWYANGPQAALLAPQLEPMLTEEQRAVLRAHLVPF